MKYLSSTTPFAAIFAVAASFAYSAHLSDAAVQDANGVLVSSSINTVNISTTLPHTALNSTASGTTAPLSPALAPNDSLAYVGSADLQVTRIPNASNGNNNDVTHNHTVTRTISFTLGANEVVDIAFTGNYALTSPFLQSQVSWSLTSPTGGNVWSPQTRTTAGTGSINESVSGVTSATGGTYTLTLINSVTGTTAERGNLNPLASSSFTNLSFTVTAIPEPSSTMVFGALGVMLLSIRRRKLNLG